MSDKGEVISVIGPSGSGKYILRCINGLEEITGGHIHVDELDIADPCKHGFIKTESRNGISVF